MINTQSQTDAALTGKMPRVMWLLNHTTLRKFEIEQFKKIGITEVFTPKSFPYDEGNLSASIDHTTDNSLTIPADDLAVLNAQDWYGEPSQAAWDIANRHFQIVVAGFFPRQITSVARCFKGSVVLRVFGLASGYSYTKLITEIMGPHALERLRALGDRFWFGASYEHLAEIEGPFLKSRLCFLPLGLSGMNLVDNWTGQNKKILFVCPRIGTSPYFKAIYDKFRKDFAGLDYIVGGAQPVPVPDPKVVGFIPRADHDANMRDCRVMYYHSDEPNHIHYHPFEAVAAGMPLVFMAGGMLDRMGGLDQPGRCRTVGEARRKIERLLAGDTKLIEAIRAAQPKLLETLRPGLLADVWRRGFSRILDGLGANQSKPMQLAQQRKKIAVIVPVGYRGGSLRGAKLFAQALYEGSRQCGEDAEVVFAHLDDAALYPDSEFDDLPTEIARRPYQWRHLDAAAARRCMHYAGHDWTPAVGTYIVPDDGACQFGDCDLWVVISDRTSWPLLPLKPYCCMVYDYLQRYENILPDGADQSFLALARAAERVFVTTRFTESDALNYAGIDPLRLKRLPLLAPRFVRRVADDSASQMQPYFLWTTNAAPHKNHENALIALQKYYGEMDGKLDCRVTGVDTRDLLKLDRPHLQRAAAVAANGQSLLRRRVHWMGDLPDSTYQQLLSGAAFLWHATRIDNGTFSVIEAAHLGVPALSSDYPAMREIADQFCLDLAWMDPHDPAAMAAALKRMEQDVLAGCRPRTTQSALDTQSIACLAPHYWEAVRACL